MNNNSGKRWKYEEIEILKAEHEKGTTYKQIALILGRNQEPVRMKGKSMGLSKRCLIWSRESESELIELHKDGLSYKEIGEILNRTLYGIKAKCAKLGLLESYNDWTKKEIDILRKEYTKGTTYEELGKLINRSTAAVAWRISALNITRSKKEWSQLEVEQLLELKSEGLSYQEISQIMGRSENSVNIKSNRLGLGNPGGRYPVDQNYFKEVDTQKKSYWLGWLMSDGNVSRKGNVSLNLSIKDKDVIEDFKNDLRLETNISYSFPKSIFYKGQAITSHGICGIGTGCPEMAKDLARYGVVPAKTYICQFPDNLDEKYYPGFIAGMISGDGSVIVHGRDLIIITTILGTYDLLEGIRQILIKRIGFNHKKLPRKEKKTKCLYRIELSHRESIRLHSWFKENSTALMPRKNKIIEDYFRQYPEKCNPQVRSA